MRFPSQSVGVMRTTLVNAITAGVLPQASRFGSFGGFGGLGIEPLPPSCTECRYECTIVSCGPNCRFERCQDVCVSVPCVMG
jgi:hypothetical protein